MFRIETYTHAPGEFGEDSLSFEMWREFAKEEDARQYFREFTGCLNPACYYAELIRYEEHKDNEVIATFGTNSDSIDFE